jgi:hypothetical protein
MKVHVRTLDPTRRRVAFSSDLGAAEAGWLGDLPEADRDYHVEIAINERLVWGTDIVATPPAPPCIAQGPAGITLDATLESIEDDGAATLRLGPSLVLIDTEGAAPPAGTSVRVQVGEMMLADTGI